MQREPLITFLLSLLSVQYTHPASLGRQGLPVAAVRHGWRLASRRARLPLCPAEAGFRHNDCVRPKQRARISFCAQDSNRTDTNTLSFLLGCRPRSQDCIPW